MIYVTFYNRRDCPLCEQALTDLQSLQEIIPHEVVVIDVQANAKLKKEYGLDVPVIEVGPYKLKAPFGKQTIEMTLGAARDRLEHIDQIDNLPLIDGSPARSVWRRADSFTYWISRHYMLIFNLLVSLYLGIAVLAPLLLQVGFSTPANLIYRVYRNMCHQLAYRSVFIFGEQSFYPRAAANVDGLLTYQQATGFGEGNSYDEIMTARTYTGDERIGYKIALCERCLAIYVGILLFGVLFTFSRNSFPYFPWYLWILFGIVPFGVDGITQLISQPPLSLIPFRESTPTIRILSGALFGFITAWFGYPMVEETMSETRQIMRSKWQRTHRSV